MVEATDPVLHGGAAGAERPVAAMRRLASVAFFQEALRSAATPLVPLNPAGGRAPIFWVHSVSGQGTDPLALARLLGPDQPFYSLRMPSERRNAASAGSVESVAKVYVEALTALRPDGPVVLAGWSAGAVIALEMAQQLRAAFAREVSLLVAVDFAPSNTGVDISPSNAPVRNLVLWLRAERRWNPNGRRFGLAAARRAVRLSLRRRPDASTTSHPTDGLVNRLGYSETERGFVRALYDSVRDYVPRRYAGTVLLFLASGSGERAMVEYEERWRAVAPTLRSVRLHGSHESILKNDAAALVLHLEQALNAVPAAVPQAFAAGRPSKLLSWAGGLIRTEA